MAEDITGGEQQQNVSLLVDDRDLRNIYSNAYRIYATADEVVIDLGFNMPNPNPSSNLPAGQQQILWKINDRLIMSYMNAKRLALSLGQLVKRYEQQFGELSSPSQRPPMPR
jgi:hypothetical protein